MSHCFDNNSTDRHHDGANMLSLALLTQKDSTEASSSSHRQPGDVTVYATTGPDAYTEPILVLGSSGQPALNVRSCVNCRRRKIRCDRQIPCSSCRRSRRPCVFPEGRRPRQSRPKAPNGSVKPSTQRKVGLFKKLSKLEGMVEELKGQFDNRAGRGPSTRASRDNLSAMQSLSHHMPASVDRLCQEGRLPGADSVPGQCGEATRKDKQKGFGRLVSDDYRGTSHYVSCEFWSKINDELDAFRKTSQCLTDEESDVSDPEGTPTGSLYTGFGNIMDHEGLTLGYRSTNVDLQASYPSPAHGALLWSEYKENVEPLIKLVHVPSVEVLLRDARSDRGKLTPGNEALMFAIYFAAITSLKPDEVRANFGASKNDILVQYRFAVEQSLAKANFLATSDLTVMQSFTLFLIVVRRHDESRFCWALTGLVVRIAQGMGLHRDGTHLKLPPFETEIRRRIWWAILVLDHRSAEELGTDMIISESSYDTLQPSNINDADISPQSTNFPIPREGRSDSTVSIVKCEICAFSRHLVAATSAMSSLCPGNDQGRVAEQERMLIDVYQQMKRKFLLHVLDETDPLYWVAALIARVIVAKMFIAIYQPMLFPGSNYEVSDEIRQNIYVAAIEVIEYYHILNTDARCKQYQWLFRTYTNWHAIAYILLETCRRPWTALVERGWDAVTGSNIDYLKSTKSSDHAAVFFPLRELFTLARKHRETELARLGADQDEARRLEFAERMNPIQARFSPVHGAENRMEQMRQKWWSLVHLERSDLLTYSIECQPASFQGPAPTTTASGDETSKALGNAPSEPNISNTAMKFMESLMSQPNPDMGDFWRISNLAGRSGISGEVGPAPASQIPLHNAMDQKDLRPQASTPILQTPLVTVDNQPHHLWSDSLTAIDANLESSGNTLFDDFDWQDWSQSVSALEVQSTQMREHW